MIHEALSRQNRFINRSLPAHSDRRNTPAPPDEELGDGILIVQLRMGTDELAVGGGKDDGLWKRR